jgi:hypothetical protein
MATNKRAEASKKRRTAQKQKPLTVGKGTGYTRPTTPGRNPRPVSARASNASKLRAAQKTTSSGITQRPDGRRQSEGRSGRTKTSTAKVTQGSNGKPASSGSARVTTGQGSRLASAASKAATVGAALSGGTKAAVFKEGITARNTADGTLKGKPTGAKQGPRVPERLTQKGVDKKTFDDAFRQARKSGQKEFTWRGKRYNTKVK